MNPQTDWSDQLGYAFFLAVVLVPPAAAVALLIWLVRKAALGA